MSERRLKKGDLVQIINVPTSFWGPGVYDGMIGIISDLPPILREINAEATATAHAVIVNSELRWFVEMELELLQAAKGDDPQ